MKQSQRGSEWLAVRRSLAILQRLMRGPASAKELVDEVLQTVGPDAYPSGEKALQAAFKRDRDNLRHQLEAEFTFDFAEQLYILEDPGPFGYLELSALGLRAIQLLSHTFAGEIGERSEVHHLLDDLISRLPPRARLSLESGTPLLDLDIQQDVDVSPVNQKVWEVVTRAVRAHRKLAFSYLSPQHDDRLPRYHEVAPYQIRYKRGHWYLYAYDLYVRNHYGQEWFDSGHRRFRLHYIQDDERLAVLPTKLSAVQRRAPRFLVHYRLLPVLARGAISRHFDEMHIENLSDGSAEVRGFTNDEWEAVQILLAYGENCVVLGGPEVLRRMERRVRKMAENYGLAR